MKGLFTKKISAGLSLLLAAVMAFSTPCAALAYEVPQEINCESVEEAVAAVEDLIACLKENGPDALREAYKYADEQGYILELQEKAAELRVIAEAEYANFVENYLPEIEKKLEELQSELEELKAELAVKKAELMAELEKLSAEVEGKIDATIAEIEAEIAEIERQINEVIEAIEALYQKLEAAVNETAAFVEAVNELNAAIEEMVAVVNGESTTSLEDAIDRVNNAAVAVAEAYENAENAKEVLTVAIKAIKPLMADVDAAIKAHVEEKFAELEAEITAYVEEKLVEIEEAVKAHVEEKLAEIEAMVTSYVESMVAQVESMVEGVIAELEAIAAEIEAAVLETAEAIVANIEAIVEFAKELYLDATTDTYEIGKDSYYVAIGDRSTYAYGLEDADGYVERFAKALGLADNQYKNLCEDCACASTSECLAEVAENADEIAKSDIVTVGFTNNTYTEAALLRLSEAAMGQETVELDWSALLPEEAVAYVDEAIAAIEEAFVESGMDAETATLLALAVESYAYSYVEYACALPALVNAIHEINPETLVVMVGMYNPLEGAVIGEGSEAMNIGAYLDAIVALSDAYGLAYAMLAENAIFVAAQDVETIAEANGENTVEDALYEYLFNGAKNLHASEAGHEYIKDQLIAALELEVGCTAHVPGANCPSAKFTDMNYAKWYHLHVDYCVENGLIYGTSDTTFDPNMDITRGMIVSILYRLSGEKAGSADVEAMTFTDVDPDKYYAKAIAWAQMNGVVYGTSETTFEPEEPITREEMVAILCRYAKYMGYDVSASADLTAYPDADNVKAWAKAPISWAAAEGLFYGAKTSTGVYKINPNGLTTRAEAASFIYRFCMLNAQ